MVFCLAAEPYSCANASGESLCVCLFPQLQTDLPLLQGLPCTGCTGPCSVLTAASGTFSDGPSDYLNYADCQWMIIAPGGSSRIAVTFTSFSTEQGYDYVRLYQCTDAVCAAPQLLAELSGTSGVAGQSFTASSGYVLVKFTSDGSVTSSGFAAQWTSATA